MNKEWKTQKTHKRPPKKSSTNPTAKINNFKQFNEKVIMSPSQCISYTETGILPGVRVCSCSKLCANYNRYGYNCFGWRLDPQTSELLHSPSGMGYNPNIKYGPTSKQLGYPDPDGSSERSTQNWARIYKVPGYY